MPFDQSKVLAQVNADLRALIGTLQVELLMAKASIAEWERQYDALVKERLAADPPP